MKDRIKSLRKHLGLTQEKFAERLCMKRNTIANYEIGRNEPIDAVVSLICKEFNVNEEWLRTGSGDMFVKMPEEDLYSKAAASVLVEDDAFAMEALKLYYQMSPKAKEAVSDYILQLADLIRERNNKKE